MLKIYGHGIFPVGLWTNIVLALCSWIFADYFAKAVGHWRSGAGKIWQVLLWGLVFVCFLPNATYLFLELRHLILVDGIADDRCLGSVLFFTGISMLGLVCAVATIVYGANRLAPLLGLNRILLMAVLSFLSSFGAVIGLLDIASTMAIVFPPVIVPFAIKLFSSWKLVAFAVGLGAFLTLLCTTVDLFTGTNR